MPCWCSYLLSLVLSLYLVPCVVPVVGPLFPLVLLPVLLPSFLFPRFLRSLVSSFPAFSSSLRNSSTRMSSTCSSSFFLCLSAAFSCWGVLGAVREVSFPAPVLAHSSSLFPLLPPCAFLLYVLGAVSSPVHILDGLFPVALFVPVLAPFSLLLAIVAGLFFFLHGVVVIMWRLFRLFRGGCCRYLHFYGHGGGISF